VRTMMEGDEEKIVAAMVILVSDSVT